MFLRSTEADGQLFSLLKVQLDKFSADQLETWSTASCTLLCCPFGTFYDKVVSSTHFHIPKSALRVKSSLIISKKKGSRTQFSPMGNTYWYRAPFGQTVTAEFHPLGPIRREVQDPVNDTVGDLDFLKFGCQSSVVNAIKSLAVIKKENTHRCRFRLLFGATHGSYLTERGQWMSLMRCQTGLNRLSSLRLVLCNLILRSPLRLWKAMRLARSV